MFLEPTVCFSSFRLDLSNRQLWDDAEPVPLRPKTFAVLRFLVEHAGCLVTRDELVGAIWPDTRGAEKGPQRCILELRSAIGRRIRE
ncbi:MAG TPA: winged helix-turn-helix domain-containing protein [Candidatus Dormibacteraeota bacterium]|nr:winged helix-turn-helix domain-containing protein [Candidatus Dormibacteraeota bacterium]